MYLSKTLTPLNALKLRVETQSIDCGVTVYTVEELLRRLRKDEVASASTLVARMVAANFFKDFMLGEDTFFVIFRAITWNIGMVTCATIVTG